MFLGIFALCVVLRLTGLDSNPGPPYVDEAASAANAMCLAQAGTSAFDERWPLFVEVLVGNWEPAMIAYPSALVAYLGDGSIGSFRLIPALAVIDTILGVFFLGQELADRKTGMYAALLASLAPWSFMAGRLFWKCPFAPLFVVWGVYAFLLGLRTRSLAIISLSALAFVVSLYSYQSAWAQTPLMLVVLFIVAWKENRRFALQSIIVFACVLFFVCMPLAVLLLSGGMMKRAAEVSVFGDGYAIGTIRFARNYLMHFDPRFLFWSGDSNLRHGVGGFGQLSWLDMFAWFVGGVALWRAPSGILSFQKLGIVAMAGILTGAVAAAMSSEGNPHGLRANGMWPFFALTSAWLLAQVKDKIVLERSVLAVSIIFILAFTFHHFVLFPTRAQEFFSDRLDKIARSEDADRWLKLARETQPVVARYYLMRYAKMSCGQAGRFVDEARKNIH